MNVFFIYSTYKDIFYVFLFIVRYIYIFYLQVKVIHEEKYRQVYEEEIRRLDRMENDWLPTMTLSCHAVSKINKNICLVGLFFLLVICTCDCVKTKPIACTKSCIKNTSRKPSICVW